MACFISDLINAALWSANLKWQAIAVHSDDVCIGRYLVPLGLMYTPQSKMAGKKQAALQRMH
eukprot:scaffold209477_cov25-Prasinocladus_malaysianus.AAC.1